MEWMQVVAIVGSNLLIMLTFFGVSISLYRHSDKKIDENRKETHIILKGIREEIYAIHEEMKDFHGRLCAIEAGRK